MFLLPIYNGAHQILGADARHYFSQPSCKF